MHFCIQYSRMLRQVHQVQDSDMFLNSMWLSSLQQAHFVSTTAQPTQSDIQQYTFCRCTLYSIKRPTSTCNDSVHREQCQCRCRREYRTSHLILARPSPTATWLPCRYCTHSASAIGLLHFTPNSYESTVKLGNKSTMSNITDFERYQLFL